MSLKSILTIIGFTFILGLISFIYFFEKQNQSRLLEEAKNHSLIVEQSLWDLYPKNAQKYLENIVKTANYQSVEIKDLSGKIFLTVEGTDLKGIDRLLQGIGLIRINSASANITHLNSIIGIINLNYRNTSIYIYLNITLILLLVYLVCFLFLKQLNYKNELEQKILERTKQLSTSIIQLKAEEEKYKGLFEHANDCILLVRNDQIVECNQKTFEVFKFNEKEIIGKNILDLTPDIQKNGISSHLLYQESVSNLHKGQSFQMEWLNKRKDGVVFESDINGNTIKLNNEVLIQLIIRDLSKSKMIENQLRQSEKMQAIGLLASGVAHDFNNVLTGILGCTNLIKKHSVDAKSQEYLKLMSEAIHRARALTSKLMSFSRNESDNRLIKININNTLDTAITLLKHTINKNITIDFIEESKNLNILGNSSSLENVILNLGINSSHAMPDGGDLIIKLKETKLDETFCKNSPYPINPGNFVEIQVIDTGAGISPENINKIFDPFFTTKEAGKGTGLGLSSVAQTILSCNGSISVSSELGRGTVFTIYFPVVLGEAKEIETYLSTISGKGVILLVDDEELIRQSICSVLESLGYTVLTAKDGIEAIHIFENEKNKVNLVLLDMIMPNMGGKETFIRLRAINHEVKVIIGSGYAQAEELHEIKAIGACDFIVKPYSTEELSHKIAKALQII